MYELALIFGLGFFTFRSFRDTIPEVEVHRFGDKIGKLWEIVHQGMRENRLLRAEKALLTILKIDEKNAAAYNRLGILYAKQKEYKDAIDVRSKQKGDPLYQRIPQYGMIKLHLIQNNS